MKSSGLTAGFNYTVFMIIFVRFDPAKNTACSLARNSEHLMEKSMDELCNGALKSERTLQKNIVSN
jgi:hypothetical protein